MALRPRLSGLLLACSLLSALLGLSALAQNATPAASAASSVQSAAAQPHSRWSRLSASQQALAQGSSLALTGPESEGLGLWSVLGSALPLVALLVGLTTVQWLDRQEIVSELAEIDTALLVDDLPPAAYSDPGFVQFLRQSAAENDTPSAN